MGSNFLSIRSASLFLILTIATCLMQFTLSDKPVRFSVYTPKIATPYTSTGKDEKVLVSISGGDEDGRLYSTTIDIHRHTTAVKDKNLMYKLSHAKSLPTTTITWNQTQHVKVGSSKEWYSLNIGGSITIMRTELLKNFAVDDLIDIFDDHLVTELFMRKTQKAIALKANQTLP